MTQGSFPSSGTDLTPVLKAIEALGERIGRLEGEVSQQGMLMRAMARQILPEEVFALTSSTRDLKKEIEREDAEKRRERARLDQMRRLRGELG